MQLTKLAPVPVLVIAASILAVLVLGVQETLVFNPPYLLLILNLVFWTGGTAAIVYFSARTFLEDGSVTALLISASILIFGISVIISGWLANFSSDYSVAIGNICPLAASMVQFIGSFAWVLGRIEAPNTHRKWLLIVTYSTAMVFVGIVSGLVLSGSLPPFFTTSGPTLLRQTVVGSTIALFGLSFLSFGWQYARSRSPVLLLYTLAIGLISIGMFSAFEVMALGDVTAWLGRIALYAGTIYIIAALIESRKGRMEVSNGWAEAFRSDRHQVETIFTRMLNGFSYHKIIVDGNGKPVDYVFLAANEAFEKMTGFKPENIIGKRVTEVLPGIEKDPADWIGAYGKVALTGQPAVIENYAQPLGKWYSVSAFSPRRGYFAAIFEDITERKKTENKLEEYTKDLEGLVEERTRKLSSSALYTRSLIEASPDPLVTISGEGKITDVNQATELVTGFPRDQLINSDFSDYFTEPDKARVGYRRVFTDRFVKDYPLAIRHKSGKITDVLYNATVYRDEAGNVQGVFAAARDVTERRKAEDTLRKQAALIDLSPDGTIVKKLDDTITFWSQGAERLYGWKRRKLSVRKHTLFSELTLQNRWKTFFEG